MQYLVVLVTHYSIEPSIQQLLLIHVLVHYTTSKMPSSNASFVYIAAIPVTSIQSALPATQQPTIEYSMQPQNFVIVYPDTTITSLIEPVSHASPNVIHAQMPRNVPNVPQH